MYQWYEEMYKNYANTYEKETFTNGTKGECDFIEKEIQYNKNLKILDIGCGTGRHSIKLSKWGCQVIGVDLSDLMLKKTRENAEKQNIQVNFKKHDAWILPYNSEFDVAIMLCEGGFPLKETDEIIFQIVEKASKTLKSKNSKFIFTTLNGLFPLFHSVKEFLASQKEEGNAEYSRKKVWFNALQRT